MNKLTHRPWIFLTAAALFLLIAGFVGLVPSGSHVVAQDTRERGVRLEDQLNTGLKVRTDEEKAYVSEVVKYVREGKLPRKLVDSTFLWVRNNRRGHAFPLIYFQRILQIRAKQLRIQVPEAKFSVGESR